jgi:hypothetical protein
MGMDGGCFHEEYQECDICKGSLYGHYVGPKDWREKLCSTCVKAVEDAIEQVKYLASLRKSNGT